MRTRLFLNFNKLYFYTWFLSIPNYKQQQLSRQLRRQSLWTSYHSSENHGLVENASFQKNITPQFDFLATSSGIRPFSLSTWLKSQDNSFFSTETDAKCKAAFSHNTVHYDKAGQLGVTPMVGPRKLYRGMDARIAAVRDSRWYSYLRSPAGYVTLAVPHDKITKVTAAAMFGIKYPQRRLSVDINNASCFITGWSVIYRKRISDNNLWSAQPITHNILTTIHNFEEGDPAHVLEKRGQHALNPNMTWNLQDTHFVSGRKRVRKHILTEDSSNLTLTNLTYLFFLTELLITKQLSTETILHNNSPWLTNYKQLADDTTTNVIDVASESLFDTAVDLLENSATPTLAKSHRKPHSVVHSHCAIVGHTSRVYPENLIVEHDALPYDWVQNAANSVFFTNLALLRRETSLSFFSQLGAQIFPHCIYKLGRLAIRGITPRADSTKCRLFTRRSSVFSESLFFNIAEGGPLSELLSVESRCVRAVPTLTDDYNITNGYWELCLLLLVFVNC